jgi:hypothetical protein
MAYSIRRVDYYYTTVEDEPGMAYELLIQLARLGINMLAFNGMPLGPDRVQLAMFPEDPHRLVDAAKKAGFALDGPHRAILVQGDDELGALAQIHAKLREAAVDVYASTAVTDGRGAYGYLIYVRPDEYDRAAQALEMGKAALQGTGAAPRP